MEIKTKKTKSILIEAEGIDPITVILEDIEQGKGKIIIECHGRSWSAYWGGMGQGTTIAEFFCSASDDYLTGKLTSLNSEIDDIDALEVLAKKRIIERRKSRDIEKEDARDLYRGVTDMESPYQQPSDMFDIFGDEWWYFIPTKPNPEYIYLCRIIAAVQDGLRSLMPDHQPEPVVATPKQPEQKPKQKPKQKLSYFSYSCENGFKLHETADEAKAAAQAQLDYERDGSSDGWGRAEGVDEICWGEVKQKTIETMRRPRIDDDTFAPDDCEFTADYKLVDTCPSANGAGK